MVTTVSAPSPEALVEAVAAVDAAGSTFFQVLAADHPIGEHFHEVAARLRVELLGGPTEEAWEPDDPTVVDIHARANELEAKALGERPSYNERAALLRIRSRRLPQARHGQC